MDALIVDDDDLMADLLETVVAGLHPDMQVAKAAGFQEAMAAWKRKPADLLIVDWNLPDGSGLEIIRQVRAINKTVTIVMITGRADRDSILKAAHYRISGYISKPFKVDMLHDRLLAVLDKVAPEAEAEPEPPPALESLLAEGLDTVIQLPARTDAASVLELIARAESLSAAHLAERWQTDAALCSRLLDVANRASFRKTGKPVSTIRDAISTMGVPMALNQALGLAMDVGATLSHDLLKTPAIQYQQQAEKVAREAQRVALALGKRSTEFFTAGLLSRVGELAVLKVMDHFLRRGGELTEDEVQEALRDWAQPYGNRLKVQWLMPLELRQLIGAVHFLTRENVTQERVIMRVAALLASDDAPEAEIGRLLRHLGLENWNKKAAGPTPDEVESEKPAPDGAEPAGPEQDGEKRSDD